MINIEIGKSYGEGKYKIRIGDIDGNTEHSQITKEQALQDISEAMEELK